MRSNARGVYEKLLYLWGAELRRCLRCHTRRAVLGNREIRLRETTGRSRSLLVGWLALGGGILVSLIVAYLALARSYRLPF